MPAKFFSAAVFFVLFPGFVMAQCVLPTPDGKFAIRGAALPLGVSSLEISSENGVLVPFESPAPFQFVLANTPNQITLGNLASLVTVEDGAVLDEGGPGGWDTTRSELFDAVGVLGTPALSSNIESSPQKCSEIKFGQVTVGDDTRATRSISLKRRVPDVTDTEIRSFSIVGEAGFVYDVPNFGPRYSVGHVRTE